ncbi:MAG: SpoIIE family protein phosphatase [Bacteroidetes bacterium]|nr:SpoIIE family protein phosphatase [Bacteroidota bacterium]
MEQPLQLSAGNGNAAAHTRYRIEDRSYLSIIKKEIAKAADGLHFSAERIGRLDIIIHELLSNLVKYGQRKRELLWKPFVNAGQAGIEILAIDGGAGITNASMALQDGYSTSGTAGEGLGAIKRLSDIFDLYSQQGQGTIVLARLFAQEQENLTGREFYVGAISVPKTGETLCGDGYQIQYDPEKLLLRLLVLDGLGHGPEAHLAAKAAITEYAKLDEPDQSKMLKHIHQNIKKTRGAVAMAAQYDFKEQKLRYCGVGNISGRLLGHDTTKALSSFNGIVGHVISSRLHDQEIDWEKGRILIVHSDGITSRWDLSKYQQIQKHDPTLIAACLYRDFNRGTDDVTVVVSKYPD